MTEPAVRAPAPLAALSHEFRTPLNAVLGMARLLEGTRLTAEQRAYVAALRQSGDHLLALVGDVLDLAKLEAGAVTLNRAPVRIDAVLQSVAELLSPRAHEKGIEIAWAVSPFAPAVIADEGRLRQVLFNLAGNAIKFTPAGGVLLGCETRAAGQDSVRLRLTVRDTGPGIPPDRQAAIFEPYAHANAGDRPDSTGLGLAIVRKLAEAHGGDCGVESSPGRGALFWFEAPFEVAAADRPSAPLRGVTVTLVTPSAILAEAAARQVEAAGGRLSACSSLAEAAEVSAAGAVVLIDQAQFVSGGRPRTVPGHPCLILLAPEQRQRIARSRAAGFAGYLIKPLRQVSLVERVLAALGRTASEAPSADERAESRAGEGARVLLVEDDPINALLARKLLEREGAHVDLAPSGEAAQAACREAAYDLILMDRRLPGGDGAATTRALRASGVATPIVALTADAFEEDRQACLAAGMDDFLVKPLDPHALATLLARVRGGGWTKPPENAKLAS